MVNSKNMKERNILVTLNKNQSNNFVVIISHNKNKTPSTFLLGKYSNKEKAYAYIACCWVSINFRAIKSSKFFGYANFLPKIIRPI